MSPLFVGYQRRWLNDPSRLKAFVKARRIGGSEVVAADHAAHAAGFSVTVGGIRKYNPANGRNQYIISASHAQAKQVLKRIGNYLRAFEELIIKAPILAGEPTAEVIRLRNGREIWALGTNPKTVRGYTGDVILDEFGAMPFADEMWAAAKSITDATLGTRRGNRLSICGTPLGDTNKFARICIGDEGAAFSIHRVTIHDAIRDGFPADADQLRIEMGDDEMFAQEYECAFLSSSSRYISAEIYDAATYDATSPGASEVDPSSPRIPQFFGMDVARKAGGDNSALVKLARHNATLWQRERVETRRGATWENQTEWVRETLRECASGAIDGTGIGSKFVEDLQSEFGGRVESVEFSLKSKEALATGLRLALSKRRLRPLADDVELKRDVLSLRRNVTTHGNVTYTASTRAETTAGRKTGKSHADRAWALALAVHAAGKPPPQKVAADTSGSYTSEAESLSSIM